MVIYYPADGRFNAEPCQRKLRCLPDLHHQPLAEYGHRLFDPTGKYVPERNCFEYMRMLLTYVDKRLITGHNDIDDPRIIEFVKQLILISTQSPEQAKAIRRLQQPAP